MPRCSIIIPVYNLAAVTRRCLDHLLDLAPDVADAEIIVVDDGSRDATPALLTEYDGRIRVVAHERNRGFATACNAGAAAARGDLLVFLNNDTVPLAGWLGALVRTAEDHRVGIVGSKLLYPDGTIQHAGIAFDQDHQPRHIYVGFPGDHPAVNKPRAMQMVTGGCLLIRRDLFARVGGFDATFLNGFEDVDLCLKARDLGFEVRYCPESTLVHLETVSDRAVDRDPENRRTFFERWGHRIEVDDWRYYVEDGLIRITYPGTAYCPLSFRVDPALGTAADQDAVVDSYRALHRRSEQVRALLKDNIALRLKLAR